MLKPTYVLLENHQAKRTKNDVEHVLSLTKKWIDMAQGINDDVLLRKLPDGDVAGKELYYHELEIKACLQTFKRQYDQLCEDLNGQHIMVTMILTGSR